MKKMILMLIVVGILVFGTVCVAEEISEDISLEKEDIFEENSEKSWGDITPCGGSGGHGGGDVPG